MIFHRVYTRDEEDIGAGGQVIQDFAQGVHVQCRKMRILVVESQVIHDIAQGVHVENDAENIGAGNKVIHDIEQDVHVER